MAYPLTVLQSRSLEFSEDIPPLGALGQNPLPTPSSLPRLGSHRCDLCLIFVPPFPLCVLKTHHMTPGGQLTYLKILC